MLIYKEKLPPATGLLIVNLPYKNATEARNAIRYVGMQRNVPCMWYEHQNDELKEYCIVAIGTGHAYGDILKREEYIGTLLLYDDSLVLHYFLVDTEEKK